jgi:hypothetical protein
MIPDTIARVLSYIAPGATMTEACRYAGVTKHEFLAAAQADDKVRERWLQACEDASLYAYWRAHPQALLQALK